MKERERADALARAIDELIRGAQSPGPQVDDAELRSLLRVAGARREAGIESGRRSADHESAIWQRLVARVESSDDGAPNNHDIPVADEDIRDIVAARRRVSEDVLALAEKHRDDVWQRVRERISNTRPKRRGIFSFLESRTDGDLPAERTPSSRTRLILTGDSDVDSLLRVALGPTSLRHAGEREIASWQGQLQARMRSDPARQRAAPVTASAPRSGFWLRAGVVAAVVVATVALAPIPVTGLSGSPAAEAARFLGEHLGVTETALTPPPPGASNSVSGQDMTAADAGSQLGLPLSAPTAVMDLSLTGQQLFPRGITSSGAGTFVASYSSADGSTALSVYEEAAGGGDLAAPDGVAVDVSVAGSPATYYEGSWAQSANGALTWQPAGAQTIVFERDGVRFTLRYAGPHIDPADLAAAASAFA
jgi:hypothetical protein